MTLTLDLAPDVLDRLAQKARAEGIDLTDIAERAVVREAGPAAAPQADDWDMPYTREEAAARVAKARAVFAQWAEEDEAADPAEAQREWEEFRDAMNQTRREEGRPPAYPEDQYGSSPRL